MKDTNKLERLMFLLGVQVGDKEDYVSRLECASTISVQQMTWLLAFVAGSINAEEFSINDEKKPVNQFRIATKPKGC